MIQWVARKRACGGSLAPTVLFTRARSLKICINQNPAVLVRGAPNQHTIVMALSPAHQTSSDETAIRNLIENWARAVRERNIPGILAHHDPKILMFDVPPPFLSKGIKAYEKTWDFFFAEANYAGIFE